MPAAAIIANSFTHSIDRVLYIRGSPLAASCQRPQHMYTRSRRRTRSFMEAPVHYSVSGPIVFMVPRASPSPSPATAAAAAADGIIPDARTGAGRPITWLNTNAVLLLALLVCGLLAAIALHVVLQCALRVAARAWYGAASAIVLREREREPAPRAGRGGKWGRALPCLAYSAGLELAGSSRSECAICLAEFACGEQVRMLPRCSHGFHAGCIDRWLAARPTCPTCRQAPFAEPEHVGADRARPAVVEMVVRVTIIDGA